MWYDGLRNRLVPGSSYARRKLISMIAPLGPAKRDRPSPRGALCRLSAGQPVQSPESQIPTDSPYSRFILSETDLIMLAKFRPRPCAVTRRFRQAWQASRSAGIRKNKPGSQPRETQFDQVRPGRRSRAPYHHQSGLAD